MRAKYLGKTEFLVLTNGKVYEVLSVERDWYRIVDDSGEDYLYPPELFELVNDSLAKTSVMTCIWSQCGCLKHTKSSGKRIAVR